MKEFCLRSRTWEHLFGSKADIEIPTISSKQDDSPTPILAKLFNPGGAGTWWIAEATAYLEDGTECALKDLVLEYDPFSDTSPTGYLLEGPNGKAIEDIHIFGVAEISEMEAGYSSLRELAEFKGHPFPIPIERDLFFTPTTLQKLLGWDEPEETPEEREFNSYTPPIQAERNFYHQALRGG